MSIDINYDTFRNPNNFILNSTYDGMREEYRLDILDVNSKENLYRRIIRIDHEITPFVNILLNMDRKTESALRRNQITENENKVLKHDIKILENEVSLLKNQIKHLEDKDEKTNKEYGYVEGWDDF